LTFKIVNYNHDTFTRQKLYQARIQMFKSDCNIS
jgi:hypothetical protein